MEFKESETVELKECVTDSIKKEIIAFANCNGGAIYVGVKDNGKVVGVEDIDDTALRVSNMVRDSIKPDLSMFVHYEAINIDGRDVLAINVQRGTSRPYYLEGKGLRPKGVFVRQGFSSVSATESTIRRLIKESDRENFEDMRSVLQELTFTEAQAEFKARKVDFGETHKQTLKLVSNEGLYTNLGLLLSDQCRHTIKVASFQGTDQSVFTDRKEFTGSVFSQLHKAYDFIEFHNKVHSTFSGLLRIDRQDYPVEAVREGLLNCIIHRDYSFSASTIISIYSDRIEFISLGGIVSGLSMDDLMVGISVCRNPHLANIFYRLELIEAYGTGIRKIMGAYDGFNVKPQFSTSENTFKLILPNVNDGENSKSFNLQSGEVDSDVLLDLLSSKESITRKDIESSLQVSSSTAGRMLSKLVDSGALRKIGGSRSTRYQLAT